MSEYTFIMIKPDGVKRNLVGRIIQRFEERGFNMLRLNIGIPSRELVSKHYEEHKEKDHFEDLIDFTLSGPIVTMLWEGPGIIHLSRQMIGNTDPLRRTPGTIRGDFSNDIRANVIHGSDSMESAKREIDIWFGLGSRDEKSKEIPEEN